MDAKNAQSPKVDRGFAPEALSVFGNVFDFYGTLGHNGRVKQLAGRIFGSTNTNPQLLIGQVFSETVFWQSSEVTAKLIEKAIAAAASGDSTDVIIDFRISSDEKIAMEIFVQPLPSSGSDAEIFIAGQAISKDRSQLNAASEQLLFAAENALIGLWFWDFEEDRIHSTPRCNELFGLPPYETFQYEDYREAIHPDDRILSTAF